MGAKCQVQTFPLESAAARISRLVFSLNISVVSCAFNQGHERIRGPSSRGCARIQPAVAEDVFGLVVANHRKWAVNWQALEYIRGSGAQIWYGLREQSCEVQFTENGSSTRGK